MNVWAGVIGDNLIGPYVFPARVNSATYLEFLNNTLDELLDVPLDIRRNMWYLHDGAPPHSSREVNRWFNDNYFDGWIGRYSKHAWPPRSPDLNVCDFYLWDHLKQIVYSTPVNSLDELQVRLLNAAKEIRRNNPLLSVTSSTKHVTSC